MSAFETTEKHRLEKRTDWYFKEHQESFNFQLTHYWYKAIKPYFRGPLALEMGPAEGVMTTLLAPDFKQLYVLDIVPKFVENAAKISPNITGLIGLFEKFETDLRFNTIIMSHVLEHVSSPVTVLKQASKWLTKGGRIIVVVPHANSLHRLIGIKMGLLKKPTDLNEGDMIIGHRRVYTKNLLEKHINQANLKLTKIGGIFLKPLSNRQLTLLGDQKLFDALYEMGAIFPESACELFAIIKK